MKSASTFNTLDETRPKESYVLGIGVGTAGCRILSGIQKMKTAIDQYAYVSTDQDDLNPSIKGRKILIDLQIVGKSSPAYVRGEFAKHIDKVRNLLSESSVLFLVAGLGGSVGTGIAPMIAQLALDMGKTCVCVVVMPFSFERQLHFRAGTCLRRLRKDAAGIVVIDNDILMESMPNVPIVDVYAAVNERISYALSVMASKETDDVMGIGLKKIMETVACQGYSVLGFSGSSSVNRAEEAVVGAVKSIYRVGSPDDVEKAILFMEGDKGYTMGELSTTTKRLTSLLGDGSLEVHHGVSTTSKDGMLTTTVLASGLKKTIYERYDPLTSVLGDENLDDALDIHLDVEIPVADRLD